MATAGPAAKTKQLVDEVGRKVNEYKNQPGVKQAVRIREAIENLKKGGDRKYHRSNGYKSAQPNGAIYRTMTDNDIAKETGVDIRVINEAQGKLLNEAPVLPGM